MQAEFRIGNVTRQEDEDVEKESKTKPLQQNQPCEAEITGGTSNGETTRAASALVRSIPPGERKCKVWLENGAKIKAI